MGYPYLYPYRRAPHPDETLRPTCSCCGYDYDAYRLQGTVSVCDPCRYTLHSYFRRFS